MAARHGRNAQLFMGSTELTPYLDNIDRSLDTDTSETTVFGKNFKEFLAGLSGQTMSCSGIYDPTLASTIETAQIAGTAWTFKYFPGGSASNQRQVSFPGLITNYSESSPVSDKAGSSFEVLASGTVTSTTL